MISSLTDADCFVGYIIVKKGKSIFPTKSFHNIIRLTFSLLIWSNQNSKDIHAGLDLFENEKSFKDNTGLLESLDPS